MGRFVNFLAPCFMIWQVNVAAKILEGHMIQDHVHMLIAIPPKYSVSEVIGYIKGKIAIAVARQFGGRNGILMVKSFG